MELPIKIDLIYDPSRKKNKLCMTITGGTFSDDEGNKLGEVRNVINVGLYIKSEKTGKGYSIDVEDLFSKIIEMEEEEEK